MSFPFDPIVTAVEAIAVAILCLGLTISTGRFVYAFAQRQAGTAYRRYRRELGRTLQLTLEFLIAADIIETDAVEKSLESLGMLAGLVLIRTFLSFALELEVSGRWPWQSNEDAQADK